MVGSADLSNCADVLLVDACLKRTHTHLLLCSRRSERGCPEVVAGVCGHRCRRHHLSLVPGACLSLAASMACFATSPLCCLASCWQHHHLYLTAQPAGLFCCKAPFALSAAACWNQWSCKVPLRFSNCCAAPPRPSAVVFLQLHGPEAGPARAGADAGRAAAPGAHLQTALLRLFAACPGGTSTAL